MSRTVYEIKVKGHLDARRMRSYEELTLTHTLAGETVLVGPVQDQAALYGVLNRLRDLGVTLLAVNQTEELERTKAAV